MISSLLSSLVVLVFGTLYPAYCSYKAVKSKNVREYVKWMMYWIVFALFTSAETFADIFISWLPFYYEIKVIFVVWLLSPYTNGSSFLYRKFVHPTLVKKENEIDDMISKAKEQGYSAVLTLGAKGISYATNLAVQAATKGPVMLDQFRRSYSTSDVTITEITDEDDPPRYDNDLALVQARRPRSNALDSEEAMNLRLQEDITYLDDSDFVQARPIATRQRQKLVSRRPIRDGDFSERKQRLETWEEDAMEQESPPLSLSSSPTSPTSTSPVSPYDPDPRRQGRERKPVFPISKRRGERYDDDDSDDRREEYEKDEPPKPRPPGEKTLQEMSLDERLKELESFDPTLSSALPPSSLSRINRHYLSGLRKDESTARKSPYSISIDRHLRSRRY